MEFGGSNAATLQRQLKRAGLEENKALASPELNDGLVFYVESFFKLTSDRLHEMGPIPTMTILKYANYYDFDQEEENDLLYFLRAMDNTFLDHLSEENKKKMKS